MLGSRRLGVLLSVSTGFFGWAAQARDVRIDDSDTSFFQLSGPWQTYTKDNFCDMSKGCAGNIDQTKTSGQSYSHGDSAFGVTGACKFRGSAIAIYGVDLQQQGMIRFRLDGGSPVAYDKQPGQLVYNSEMFRASGLATDIEHTLSWTVELSSVSGGSVILDYAVITVPDVTNTPSSPTVPAPGTTQRTTTPSTTAPTGRITAGTTAPSDSSTSTTSQADGSDTRRGPSTIRETNSNVGNTIITSNGSTAPFNAGTQTAPGATNPTEASASNGSNTAAIAGGAVAGVLGAVILGALIFLYIRKQRHQRPLTRDVEPFEHPTTRTTPPSFVNFSPVTKGHRESVQESQSSSDRGMEQPSSAMEARIRYLEQRLEEGDIPPPLYDRGDHQTR